MIYKVTFLLFFISSLQNSYATTNQIMNNREYKKDLNNLTDLQRRVTQEDGTEKAFSNEYWDNKKEGIYVDVTSGEPLFSSKDKYKSGTGWPSFTKPIDGIEIIKNVDKSLGIERVEARSKYADSHLGHIFDDGPKDAGGNRFCINSAALRFIPKENLTKEGYTEYLKLFNLSSNSEKALLAGGCFWGTEELIRKLDGVTDVKAGYSGGEIPNPTYEIITTGISGHAETIEITFNPKIITYERILKFFFKIHNPTTLNKQGNDVGSQYRSAIFYLNDKQKKTAQNILKQADKSGIFDSKIVTEITKAGKFYEAEEYHQDYLQKNPNGYTCHFIRNDWDF